VTLGVSLGSLMTTRRGLLLELGAVIAAPAIVRFDSLMPVRVLNVIIP
jgi:hypothetical protein